MSDAIELLIPHRAPMRFIDALTNCTNTSATATVNFPAAHFAVADGAVLETALVECVAQTAAAALGYRAKNSGNTAGPANGMLVAVINFQIHSRPCAEKTLRIEIHERKRLGPMVMISGEISCEGQPVASGDLTLYA